MFKIEYTHADLKSCMPSTVFCLLEYNIHPKYCFSCMEFETFDIAMDTITGIAERIVEIARKNEKEMKGRLPFRMVKSEDGKSVSLQYFLYVWVTFATWSIYESMESIRVVFRGEDGMRQAVTCSSAEEFFKCVRTMEQLNDRARILLVTINGATAYSSLVPQSGLKKLVGLQEVMDWLSSTPAGEECPA